MRILRSKLFIIIISIVLAAGIGIGSWYYGYTNGPVKEIKIKAESSAKSESSSVSINNNNQFTFVFYHGTFKDLVTMKEEIIMKCKHTFFFHTICKYPEYNLDDYGIAGIPKMISEVTVDGPKKKLIIQYLDRIEEEQ